MESMIQDGENSEDFEEEGEEEENKLEITRNPFDSQLYEKQNFPLLDASVFQETMSPKRESNEGFRWSLDHIARMKPAEISPFPNQEYSVIYEKKEDEEKDQKKVEEYFKNVLLPSPWLESRTEMLKRVTFSPHPPTTRYISEHQDSSYLSSNSYTSPQQGIRNSTKQPTQHSDETLLSDACCQTMLTFPVNFDLQDLIGNNFYTYTDDSGAAKELMVSSLRRKLFGQDNRTPVKNNIDKISPKSLLTNYATSSPTKHDIQRKSGSSQKSIGSSDHSPRLSSASSTPSVFSPEVLHSPMKQASNVGTPQHLRNLDVTFSSVDVSPIQNIGLQNNKQIEESNYSFLPDVSFDLNATEDEVKASCRNVQLISPDISPIKNESPEESFLPTSSNLNTDSIDTVELGQQSIKESTARGIHAFSGFDISSINDYSLKRQQSDIQEDVGPLDITELVSTNEKDGSAHTDDSKNNQDDDDDEGSYDALDITDLEPALTSNKDTLSRIDNKLGSSANENLHVEENQFVSPTFTRITGDSLATTPLKGILKHREVTPKRVDLDKGNFEESTRYNTVCNSGKQVYVKQKTVDDMICCKPSSQLPRPVLGERSVNQPNIVIDSESLRQHQGPPDLDVDVNWQKATAVINDTTLSDDVVSMRANSALKRAKRLTNSFEKDFPDDNKENTHAWQFRRNVPLNSTELTGSSDSTSSGGEMSTPTWSDIAPSIDWSNPANKTLDSDNSTRSKQIDSGISGMEWTASLNQGKQQRRLLRTPLAHVNSSISPLLRLNQLSLSARKNVDSSPWKRHDRSVARSYEKQSRLSVYRRNTWPNKEGFRSFTPTHIAPRSRVVPRRHTPMGYKSNSYKPYDPIKSAYNDLLPSPLK